MIAFSCTCALRYTFSCKLAHQKALGVKMEEKYQVTVKMKCSLECLPTFSPVNTYWSVETAAPQTLSAWIFWLLVKALGRKLCVSSFLCVEKGRFFSWLLLSKHFINTCIFTTPMHSLLPHWFSCENKSSTDFSVLFRWSLIACILSGK